MSIAKLNKIVRETTTFYNTKRERDGIPIRRGWVRPTMKAWTGAEIKKLKENLHLSNSDLASLLNRTVEAVRKKRSFV